MDLTREISGGRGLDFGNTRKAVRRVWNRFSPEKWLFVHIPKTAGTSFRIAMTDSLGDRFYPNSEDLNQNNGLYLEPDKLLDLYPKLQSRTMVSGHFRAVLAHHLPDKRRKAVFLRDPVARAKSMIGHAQKFGFLKIYKSPGSVLADCDFVSARLRDAQTRSLAPVHSNRFDVNFRFDVDDEIVEATIDELRTFEFVGFVDDRGSSLRDFRKATSLAVELTDQRLNPGPKQQFTEDEDDFIKELVRFDKKLWTRACEEFR